MEGAAPDPVAEDLYEADILAWSNAQADHLRRVAAGERVNDVDWTHVIEEIEEVGKSEVRAVRSALRQAIVHALKTAAWPENDAARHWRHEAVEFLSQARADFQPGMAQAIDLPALHRRARQAVEALDMDAPPRPLPEAPACTLAEAMDDEVPLGACVARLAGG
jgi:uncharacterized protein DUF29